MFKLSTTARKLKVTTIIDPVTLDGRVAIPDGAPSRTLLTITIADRTVTADIATKSIRKAMKTITENGADNVAVLIQGTLVENRIEEAGIVAQVKAAKEPAPT